MRKVLFLVWTEVQAGKWITPPREGRLRSDFGGSRIHLGRDISSWFKCRCQIRGPRVASNCPRKY